MGNGKGENLKNLPIEVKGIIQPTATAKKVLKRRKPLALLCKKGICLVLII